jgi:hypothetical protein
MMDEGKLIDAGRRIKAFLEDDAVKQAWIDLEKRYFNEFKAATSPEVREAIHARALALDDLFTTVLGTVNSAKLAQHQRDVREAADAREAARRTPRQRGN